MGIGPQRTGFPLIDPASRAAIGSPAAPAALTGACVDWPTVGVAVFVYAGFLLVTWFYHALPWWAVAACGGALICLHGSLQHEAIHGQPTRSDRLNTLIVAPSLWLWLPYSYYRETHLAHHRDERLTDPIDDPESNYVTRAEWRAMGPLHRALRRAMSTLLGRLLLAPPYVVVRTLATLARRLRARDCDHLRHWLLHLPGAALVLIWVIGVCEIPFGAYLLLFVYPGLSLSLLRSFAEHQAAVAVPHRTAIVEAGPLMSLLYLNNNLHLVHHNEPGLVWHQRWNRYRSRRNLFLAANDGYCFRGYGELFARYLLRSKEPVVHPLNGS